MTAKSYPGSDPKQGDCPHSQHHACQRLLGILPPGEESRISSMLGIGLHSAVQIAGMAKPAFLEQWAMLYAGEEELGKIIYQNAVARRAFVVLHHIRAVQDQESHYLAARFQ